MKVKISCELKPYKEVVYLELVDPQKFFKQHMMITEKGHHLSYTNPVSPLYNKDKQTKHD